MKAGASGPRSIRYVPPSDLQRSRSASVRAFSTGLSR